MTTALLQYEVRPEELDEHLRLLRAVFAELDAARPEGLRYATWQLDDEVRFVELVAGEDLPHPLPALASFRRYRAGLDERCVQRSFTELTEVGRFGLPA
jgi:hypothetical protein